MNSQIVLQGSLPFLNLQITIVTDFILIFRNSIHNKKPCSSGYAQKLATASADLQSALFSKGFVILQTNKLF